MLLSSKCGCGKRGEKLISNLYIFNERPSRSQSARKENEKKNGHRIGKKRRKINMNGCRAMTKHIAIQTMLRNGKGAFICHAARAEESPANNINKVWAWLFFFFFYMHECSYILYIRRYMYILRWPSSPTDRNRARLPFELGQNNVSTQLSCFQRYVYGIIVT